jgi:two-component system chemotaxis response regulator CheY
MVSMTLTTAGFNVLEAANGAEGLEKATTNTVHAILSDINMPIMTGMEFLRKFRETAAGKGVPVVLLTTESSEDMKRQAREIGATGWIVKPFKQDQLIAIVKKVAGA